MANFFDPKSEQGIPTVQISRGGTFVLGLYGGAGEDLGYSDLFVSSSDPDIVRCRIVTKLAQAKTAYYNQTDLSKIDTVEVRAKGSKRYFQLLGLKEGSAQIRATLDAAATPANHYSEAVTVTVVRDDRFLPLGVPFSTLWSEHPGDDEPCDVQGLAGQCAVKMGVMFQESNVSLGGLGGLRCWGKGPAHKNHFLDPNDVGRWLTGKGRPYIWTASAVEPEPMPGLAARTFADGKTGIVMFLDFWNVGTAAPSLDHMDVWNKNRQAHGAETYFLRSREVRFWQISP